MIFVIASNNKKKIEELSRILFPLGIYAKTAEQLGKELDEVEETGTTFAENAELKAKAACEKTGYPAIADDSGLMVDALGGRPGVYSARYAGENATDEQKINKLLDEMFKSGSPDRDAHFECVICCYFPNGEKIFFIEGNKTFAEIPERQKDLISHRGRALKELSQKLKKKYGSKQSNIL